MTVTQQLVSLEEYDSVKRWLTKLRKRSGREETRRKSDPDKLITDCGTYTFLDIW